MLWWFPGSLIARGAVRQFGKHIPNGITAYVSLPTAYSDSSAQLFGFSEGIIPLQAIHLHSAHP